MMFYVSLFLFLCAPVCVCLSVCVLCVCVLFSLGGLKFVLSSIYL